MRSTKTSSPTGYSGTTSLRPTGDSFMYIDTSSKSHGKNVFVSWEGTDVINTTNIKFCYKRFFTF